MNRLLVLFLIYARLGMAADPMPKVVYTDTDGTISCLQGADGMQNLLWISASGEKAVITSWKPSLLEQFKLPSSVFREGEDFSIIISTGAGPSEYWRYKKTPGEWVLTAASPIRLTSGRKIVQTSLDEFNEVDDQGSTLSSFKVTDIPLVPEADGDVRKLILKDGFIFKPKGIHIGNALWDQPLEKIMQDHEARKLKSGAGMKTSKQTPSDAANSGNDSKLSASESGNQSANTRWFAVTGVAAGLIGAIILWRRSRRH